MYPFIHFGPELAIRPSEGYPPHRPPYCTRRSVAGNPRHCVSLPFEVAFYGFIAVKRPLWSTERVTEGRHCLRRRRERSGACVVAQTFRQSRNALPWTNPALPVSWILSLRTVKLALRVLERSF